MATETYDLLLRGGHVIDPDSGLSGPADIAVAGGKISAVGSQISGTARETVDVSGSYVVPGLVDFHVHVYWGSTVWGLEADKIGAAGGTTSFLDTGSAGAITEAGIKTVIRECFDNGGEPDTIMVGAFNKQAISDLTQSVSSLRTSADKVAPAHVVASVDIYVSDFGTMKIIPNRFSGAGDCWFLDFDFWSVSYLRDFKTEDLAKTGDSQKKHILVEYGLKSKNQKASGYLADLTTS